MNNNMDLRKIAALALVVSLGGVAPTMVAAQTGNSPQTDDRGSGYGMGPGMMGDYGGGMGSGMMGAYGDGMGPGMMNGYAGPGMSGPFGWGWGGGLDLTEAQEASINKIRDETRKAHWALMGEMLDLQARLRDLYAAPKRDTAAIGDTYKAMGKLRQQMYDSSVAAHKRIEAVLTKEQQEKFQNYWRNGEAAGW